MEPTDGQDHGDDIPARPGATQPPPTPTASLWESLDTLRNVGGPTQPPTRFARSLEALAWIVGVVGLFFLGRIYALVISSPAPSAYEVGATFGTIAGAVIVGVVVRWIFVRARHVGRVRSPWILVVAMALLLVGLGRGAGLNGPTVAALPISTYLEIDAPYALAAATADETAEFKTALAGSVGAYEVRRVTENDGLVGFLIVGNVSAGASPDWRGIERGFESNSGADARQVVVGGRTALVGTTASTSVVIWIESPYMLAVYGIDEESANALAESVMSGYDQ